MVKSICAFPAPWEERPSSHPGRKWNRGPTARLVGTLCRRRMLALGSGEGKVTLVDEETGQEQWSVQAHSESSHTFLAMHPDGGLLASASDSEECWKLLDPANGAVLRTGARHDGTGACTCGVQHNGRPLLQEGCPVVAHTAELLSVAFSPCGKMLATGGNDGWVILWDARTGKAVQVMQGYSHKVSSSVTFSADGARVASGSNGGSLRVWDVTTGALFRTIPQAPQFVSWVRFSPLDSRRLASVAHLMISLWDVESGEMITIFNGRRLVVFSPDGRTIATVNARSVGDVHLVDAESGALRLRLVAQQTSISALEFSPGGSKLASGDYDGSCTVWDASTGALLQTILLEQTIITVALGRDWVQAIPNSRPCAITPNPEPRAKSETRTFDNVWFCT